MKELKKQNKLTSDKILIGQVLTVPNQGPQNNQLQPNVETEIFSSEEQEKGYSEFYTIVPGDTLWSLSERFGVPFAKLKRVNHLNTNHIQADQKLYIPGDKYFATAIIIGATDNTTVEFYTHGEPLPLKVSHGTSVLFQKITNQEVFITYKNGALISFY
ncbi:LysM peptidoglycan-binding domain-containing protein [Neobacillus sp. D3-1R]|uniref:LysM peptidoglycan-binding domain-containing protein n=1 Tax=Neobacillus sp. D3-1R TaxID=3445778 RepID=UPI003FA0B04A